MTCPPQLPEEKRFEEYLVRLAEVIGHEDRREPLRAYLTGLLLPGERKSVEPMAAKVDPRRVRARHQSMHHLVAHAPWNDDLVLGVAVDYALAQFERHGPLGAWVVDDTGIPKKGRHSVGVARQYCGNLGKQENCQVTVSISLVNVAMSVPCIYQLYLPESWANDAERRLAAAIPDEVTFKKKWQIALDGIDDLLAEQFPLAPIVADAGYGDTTEFRDELTERCLGYMVGTKAETTIWPPGQEPLPAKQWSGQGRPPKRRRRSADHKPISIGQFALGLPKTAWHKVSWREGARGMMESRFALKRVRPAHRDEKRSEPRAPEWLLIEWPNNESQPTKYWFSNLSEDATLDELVYVAKLRWRVERDYQELKDELGLDHFEGRGWRGFHHHGVLCIAAYAFLIAERARLSPPAPIAFLKAVEVPRGFRPRGAAATS